MKKLLLPVSMVLLVGVVLVLWFARAEEPTRPLRNTEGASPHVVPVPALAVREDAAVVHGLTLDASGHLKIDTGTRRAIAALLGSSEKVPSASDIARAQAMLQARLQEPARSEALRLLQDYLAYERASRAQSLEKDVPPAADNRLAAIVAVQNQSTLRDKYLGQATNQALFGDEDAIARYRLARQQVQQMTGLSSAQKEEQISLLYQQLPASAQASLRGAGEEPAAGQ